MKNKVLKAMACFMSVCMLSMSLAGCGDDAGDKSSTPGSDTPKTSDEQPSGGADDESQPEENPGTPAVEDRSNGLFPAYDLGGIELKLLAYNDLGNKNPDSESLDPTDEDDDLAIADKAKTREDRQDMKDYIEAKYNVKLTFVELPTNDWEEIPNQLVMDYTSGHPDADVMDLYFQHMGTIINNNMLYDFANEMDGRYKETKLFNWAGGVYAVGSFIAGEGLYYNKTMIKALMDYTPAEMFAMGQWSYDDCFAYLQELQNKMDDPADYALFVDPYYWTIFAPLPNGGQSLFGNNGDLRYLDDAGLETEEFLLKLIENGLDPIPAVYDEESGELLGYGTWSYPGNTFDKGEHVAIAHRASWQASFIDQSVFELGFVPYPWGSAVTVGDPSKIGDAESMDAYLTLQNYVQACFDGQGICLTNGIQDKADPMQVLSMMVEFMGWNSFMSAYEEESGSSSGPSFLEEGLDTDLYNWALDRTVLDNWYLLGKFDAIDWIDYYAVYYEGDSLRSALESAYNADMQSLIDKGFTSADVWSADFDPYEVEGGEEEAEE